MKPGNLDPPGINKLAGELVYVLRLFDFGEVGLLTFHGDDTAETITESGVAYCDNRKYV